MDRLWCKSKTCLIQGPSHSSDEYKLLGDFGVKYVKVKPNKDRGNHHVTKNKLNRQQENNAILNNSLNEILLHEIRKVSDAKEAVELLEYDYD